MFDVVTFLPNCADAQSLASLIVNNSSAACIFIWLDCVRMVKIYGKYAYVSRKTRKRMIIKMNLLFLL